MRKVLLATVFCLCGGTALAQTITTEELGNRIDTIPKQMLSRPVAGISIAVARDGQVVIARSAGGTPDHREIEGPFQQKLRFTKSFRDNLRRA